MITLTCDSFKSPPLHFAAKPTLSELVDGVRTAHALDTAHPSYPRFAALINTALGKLSKINAAYLLLMASPYRFDDACGVDDWRAIQIDDYRINNGSYFRRELDKRDPRYADGGLASTVLDKLEKENWRCLFENISGLDPRYGGYLREFALLRVNGGTYLILSDSVEGDEFGGVYQINEGQGLTFIGWPTTLPVYWTDDVDVKVDKGIPLEWLTITSWAEHVLAHWEEKTLPHPTPSPQYDEAGTARDVPGGALTPDYLQDTAAILRKGNLDAAVYLMMHRAELSEPDARNWIKTHMRHLLPAGHRDKDESLSERIARIFSPQRKSGGAK